MEVERRSRERRAGAGPTLTPREVQVLSHVLGGGGNKQIAGALGVSEQAIKEHVSSLLIKFDVPNRAALAEAGARLEFSGERGVDRSWMRDLFLDAQPQIAISRGPDLRFEAANEAFMEAVGRRAVIGKTVRETFPELEGQGVLETGEQVYLTGIPVVEHEVERTWDRGNGLEARVIDLIIQPLHDEMGVVNGIVSFAVDVTDLVAKRRRSLVPEQLEAAIELLPSACVVVNAQGCIVRMNEPARALAIHVEPTDAPIARALEGATVPSEDVTCLVGEPPRAAVLRVAARPLIDAFGVIVGAIAVYS
jgi:DNA-binding CsgD family transcriptional regulator